MKRDMTQIALRHLHQSEATGRAHTSMFQDPQIWAVALPARDWVTILECTVMALPLLCLRPKLSLLFSETVQLITRDIEPFVISTLDDPRRLIPLEVMLRPRHVWVLMLSILFGRKAVDGEHLTQVADKLGSLFSEPHPEVQATIHAAFEAESPSLAIRILRIALTPLEPQRQPN